MAFQFVQKRFFGVPHASDTHKNVDRLSPIATHRTISYSAFLHLVQSLHRYHNVAVESLHNSVPVFEQRNSKLSFHVGTSPAVMNGAAGSVHGT
jgi:hypothetical protein